MQEMTLSELRRMLVHQRLDPPAECTLVFGGEEWDDDCPCAACIEERVYRSPEIVVVD